MTLAVAACAGVVSSALATPVRARSTARARISAKSTPTRSRSHGRLPPQSTPLGVPGKWTLIVDSEFTGTKLDRQIWRPEWFSTGPAGTTGPINIHELACYKPGNGRLPGNNSLELSLTAAASRCDGRRQPYTGALISSNPHDGRASGGFAFTYGLVQVRLFVPASDGHILNWPAVMTLGQHWPEDGEDDILEGFAGTICHRFHSLKSVAVGVGSCLPGGHGGWYTVAADLEPGSVTWYYNGARVGWTNEVTGKPMYVAIVYTASTLEHQLAAPATLRVAYVRVWQHPGAIASGLDRSQF